MFPLDYKVQLASAGLGPEPSDSDVQKYFHFEVAVSSMFWIVIYLVKLSFLMLYKQIFGISRLFMKAWWPVLAYTLLTFCICFVAVFWSCLFPTLLFNIEACLSEQATEQSNKVIIIWCALNTTSDIAIMALPLWMLKKLQMRLFHKIGLASIFLLAWIDVVFDILRTYHTIGGTTSLSVLWDILEPTIAVVIATMPTYRALFSRAMETHSSKRSGVLTGNSTRMAMGEPVKPTEEMAVPLAKVGILSHPDESPVRGSGKAQDARHMV